MKKTAVEWFAEELNNWRIKNFGEDSIIGIPTEVFEEALEMERMQIFKSKNISAREAYKAGQHSMYCGCYEIDGCTNYEEWLYEKIKFE